MRKGITVSQAQKIVRFFRNAQGRQLLAMTFAVILAVVASIAFLLSPSEMQTSGAVFLVQPSNSPGGTAFLISDHLLLTASHVIGQQQEVYLSFRNLPAIRSHVVFVDAANDIALLEAQELDPSLVPLPLGDSDSASEGEDVIILGYPSGEFFETRVRLAHNKPEELAIEAPAHPGNSGGALLRVADHSVVGLIGSTRELGSNKDTPKHWAVPINLVKRICRQRQRPID
jgi:S1-C subfamily serine protease